MPAEERFEIGRIKPKPIASAATRLRAELKSITIISHDYRVDTLIGSNLDASLILRSDVSARRGHKYRYVIWRRRFRNARKQGFAVVIRVVRSTPVTHIVTVFGRRSVAMSRIHALTLRYARRGLGSRGLVLSLSISRSFIESPSNVGCLSRFIVTVSIAVNAHLQQSCTKKCAVLLRLLIKFACGLQGSGSCRREDRLQHLGRNIQCSRRIYFKPHGISVVEWIIGDKKPNLRF